MADNIQTLLVSLEARIAGYEREMKRAVGIANRNAKSIESRFAAMNRNISTSMNALSVGIGQAFAGAAVLRGAQVLVDASTRIENSLKVAGLAGEDLADTYDSLFASAQRNATPLEALVDLYGRASLVQKELGVSSEELLGFTDKIAVALRVSGKSAAESSGALLQLSQALGSGVVRAEEFNSIQEGALPVLQAVAAGLEEAGGSVAKLRGLVIDGKVSSEAFFRAFEAGSGILTDKVANAEFTISQGFVRLQNVLIDTAGKFDNATGASTRFANWLQQVSNGIESLGNTADANAPAISRFVDWLLTAGDDLGNSMLGGVNRDLEAIAGAVNAINYAVDRYGSTVTDAELATAQAEQALANFANNGAARFGELEPVVRDLIQQILEGKGSAEQTAVAIDAIGEAGDFGSLITDLGGLVTALFAVRSEATATAAAIAATASGQTAGTNIAGQRAEQLVNRPKPPVQPVSLSDYKPPVGAGSGSGGGGKSPAQKLDDTLKDQAEENRLLAEKTALQATLNPLVEDYGLAVEKLRVQQELQAAATEAGLELTPALKAQIDELATGYANASVEAEKLAQSQDQMKQIAGDFGAAEKSAIQGFIQDLRDGKSAADALGNAMSSILDSVIQIGLNMLLGGGGGIGGLLGGLFGFANGGIASHGKPKMFANGGVSKTAAIFGEAGPEAAVPLPDGRSIPVKFVGAPGPVPRSANSNGGALTVQIDLDNDLLNARVVNTAGKVVAAAAPRIIGAANDSAPAAVTTAQARYG